MVIPFLNSRNRKMDLVVFEYGEHRFAVQREHVLGVAEWSPTQQKNWDGSLLGVASFDDKMAGVYDLGKLTGLPALKKVRTIIVLDVDGEAAALTISRLQFKSLRVDRRELRPIDEFRSEVYVYGAPIQVLSPEAIFSPSQNNCAA